MSGKKRQQAVAEDEDAFPRGGGDDLTPLERRKLSLQAEADFKHEQDADGDLKRSKKKQKVANEQDDAEGAFFSKTAAGKEVQQVLQLKYKSLSVGMKMLGCVLEVSDELLTVSLPHGLRATVTADETSDLLHLALEPSSKRGAKIRDKLPGGVPPPLTQLFSVGQYVRCSIKHLGGSSGSNGGSSSSKKSIAATLRLKVLLSGVSGHQAGGGLFEVGQVLPAVVDSIEDRGYSLNFGVKGVQGFLPSKDYATYYGEGSTPLLPGTLLDVIVTKQPVAAAHGAVVQVSVSHDAISGGLLKPWDGLNMATLLPGMMVTARVRQIARDGLLVSFGGFFHGSIDTSHLGAPIHNEPWQKRYQVGQKLPARLLYVDPSAKSIGLSCLTHIINLRLPTAVPRMGQVFESASIAHVDPHLGCLLVLPMDPEPACGFVHLSNLVEGEGQLTAAEVVKRFKVGQVLPGRVIGFRLVDGLVALSCKKSVIEQQVYSVEDLYPGQPLDVTVVEVTPSGVRVALTQNLQGLVPKLHMSDSAGAEPKTSKFKPGKKLPARVLSVDVPRKRVTLTLKRGLLGSKLPLLSALHQAVPGMKLHGVVTGVKPSLGVFVGFYGGVAGLMPVKQLDLLPGQQPEDVYTVGQLLRVQVVNADLRKNKLYLKPASQKAAAAEDDATAATAAAAAAAAADATAAAAEWGGWGVGSVIEGGGVVQQVLRQADDTTAAAAAGGLVELLITGADGRQVVGHLPASHLSDHPGGCDALLSVLKPGLTLPGPLLVLRQRKLNLQQQQLNPFTNRWQGDQQQQQQGLAAGNGSLNPASEEDDEEDEGESSEDEQVAKQQQQKQQQRQAAAVAAVAAEDGSDERTPVLLLSRKQSLVAAAAAGQLPASPAEVSAGSVLPGYVANVTRDGVFVRFLGVCTGRAGLSNMADIFITDPTKHFNVGQSVYVSVLTVDESSGRFTLSLKPSVVGRHGGDFLAAYASDLELAYKLNQQAEAAAAADGEEEAGGSSSSPTDFSSLSPGRLVAARLDHFKDYGAVMDIVGQEDLVGLVFPDQGAKDEQLIKGPGQLVKACVLEVNKVNGVVELSLLPELTRMAAAAAAAAGSSGSSKEQQQPPAVGDEVQVVVQVIKDNHVVVAVQQQQQQQQQGKKSSSKKSKATATAAVDGQQQQQQYVALGFMARADMNSQGSAGKEMRRFSKGEVLSARVVAVPSEDNGMWLLLEATQPPSSTAAKAAAAAGSSKPGGVQGSSSSRQAGVVNAKVVAVHDWNMEVVFGFKGSTARIHIAELQERLTAVPTPNNPLAGFKVHQEVTAAYLGHPKTLSKRGRTKDVQLSLRPAALQAAKQAPPDAPSDSKKPLCAPVLTPNHLHPNLLVVGWVTTIEQNALWLTLAPGIHGKVHVYESGDNPQQLAIPLEERFSVGQGLQAVIKGVDHKQHSLSLSLRTDRIRLGLTEPAAAAAAATAAREAAAAEAAVGGGGSGSGRQLPPAGQLVFGKVSKVLGAGVLIELTKHLQGLVALTDLHDDWVPNALSGLSPGQFVRARVLGAPPETAAAAGSTAATAATAAAAAAEPLVDSKGHLMLSLKPSDGGAVSAAGWGADAAAAAAAMQQQQQVAAASAAGGLLKVDELKTGAKVQGYVRAASPKGVFVTLDRAHHGRVIKSRLSDGFIEDLAAAFPIGTLVQARIVSVEHSKPQQQQQQQKAAAAGEAAAAAGAGGFKRRAFRVLEDDGVRIELTLKSGELGGLKQLSDFEEGEITRGKVRRLEPYGVFVELHRSKVCGLVHISQLDKGAAKDSQAHYTPGQLVNVRIMSIDTTKHKVSLSMKAELLVGADDEDDVMSDGDDVIAAAGGSRGKKSAKRAADFDEEMVDALDEQQQGLVIASEDESSEEDEDESSEEGDESSSSEDESEGQEDVDLDDMDVSEEGESSEEGEEASDLAEDESEDESSEGADDVMPPRGLHNLLQPEMLGTSGAADWGELQLADDDAAAAAVNGTKAKKEGLSRADKKRLKEQREAEIRAAEQARLAGPAAAGAPESSAEYEQQLLASPNNSYLWIKYMAFQLKLGEIDAARRIAERALSTIAITSERDKFNVWVALMNLEDAYGGEAAETALMAVFNRALQVCDPKPLHLALLGNLERSGRRETAAQVWRTATKKFNTSCKVWLGAYESALQAANQQAAAAAGDDSQQQSSTPAAAAVSPHQVLERALKSLPKRKHIKALTRAALAEFRIGCAERGRSILEGVLATSPKRIDLWNVYVDQEVKAGDAARVRSLLSRATSLALPPKKMKGLFRRWLEYEQSHGSEADVAAVKQRAMDYMEAHAAAA